MSVPNTLLYPANRVAHALRNALIADAQMEATDEAIHRELFNEREAAALTAWDAIVETQATSPAGVFAKLDAAFVVMDDHETLEWRLIRSALRDAQAIAGYEPFSTA